MKKIFYLSIKLLLSIKFFIVNSYAISDEDFNILEQCKPLCTKMSRINTLGFLKKISKEFSNNLSQDLSLTHNDKTYKFKILHFQNNIKKLCRNLSLTALKEDIISVASKAELEGTIYKNMIRIIVEFRKFYSQGKRGFTYSYLLNGCLTFVLLKI